MRTGWSPGKAGSRLRGEQLRGLLALMVLAVGAKLAFDLVATPADLFSISEISGFGG